MLCNNIEHEHARKHINIVTLRIVCESDGNEYKQGLMTYACMSINFLYNLMYNYSEHVQAVCVGETSPPTKFVYAPILAEMCPFPS